MSIFGIILLGLFLWYVVRPLFKVYRSVNKLRKGDLSGLGDLFGQPGAQRAPRNHSDEPDSDNDLRGRRAGWTRMRPQRKKINKDVGEYVKFTEVKTASTSTTSSTDGGRTRTTTYTEEQQITDAEWEEIN